LDEVTRGQGKVIPSSEIQALQTLDAGVVEEFLAKEGEQVKAGQVLVRLNAIEAESDLGANESRYLGLLASITRLSAEAEGKASVDFPDEVMKGAPRSVTEELNAFSANRRSLQGQIDVMRQQMNQREQEVRELNTRISDTRGVIALQREEAEMIRPLVARGSAPELELLQLERGIKEKQAELNGYTSSIPRAQSAISEARARINEIESNAKAQAQAELGSKMLEMNEIKERLGALEQRKGRMELKSPVNGTIQEITVNTIGGVVRPGEDFIKIVPEDDQLIIEAKVRPSDRAFIFPGQKAVIKLTAYDFSIYGGLEGELVNISADTIEDQEGNSFYRVKLRTYETELKRKGEILPITVGMVATADILTGKKTVMEYLLKPFIKTVTNALSER
jgi:adhesin transport system membrane fusion protein